MSKRFHQRLVCVVVLAAIVLFFPSRTFAWGYEGHNVVAGIAEEYLKRHSPAALNKAKQLLGGKSLADVATYADDIRNRRQYTKNWHFVDIHLSESNYEPARDCKSGPNGDCSVQALYRFRDILSNSSEEACVRAEALKFIVHIVGDIHQPLHNIDDNDRGGNEKFVKFYQLQGYEGNPPNLHQVWDSGIIAQNGKSISTLVTTLYPADDANIDMRITNWVLESHQLAVDAYNRLPEPEQGIYTLDKDHKYYESSLQVVNSQLTKAGLRLGKLLEKALA